MGRYVPGRCTAQGLLASPSVFLLCLDERNNKDNMGNRCHLPKNHWASLISLGTWSPFLNDFSLICPNLFLSLWGAGWGEEREGFSISQALLQQTSTQLSFRDCQKLSSVPTAMRMPTNESQAFSSETKRVWCQPRCHWQPLLAPNTVSAFFFLPPRLALHKQNGGSCSNGTAEAQPSESIASKIFMDLHTATPKPVTKS